MKAVEYRTTIPQHTVWSTAPPRKRIRVTTIIKRLYTQSLQPASSPGLEAIVRYTVKAESPDASLFDRFTLVHTSHIQVATNRTNSDLVTTSCCVLKLPCLQLLAICQELILCHTAGVAYARHMLGTLPTHSFTRINTGTKPCCASHRLIELEK